MLDLHYSLSGVNPQPWHFQAPRQLTLEINSPIQIFLDLFPLIRFTLFPDSPVPRKYELSVLSFNCLGLPGPHAHSLSVCLFLCICVVCGRSLARGPGTLCPKGGMLKPFFIFLRPHGREAIWVLGESGCG